MRIIKLIFFLLVLIRLPALNAQSQTCGGGFSPVKVSDSKGKSIHDVVIEIVAKLLTEEYKNARWGKVIKMSVSDAKSAIKRNLPMDYTEDPFCKNPLKQHLGMTEVKKLGENQPSIKNFGFCTAETGDSRLLLKVSAPGYLTDYYIGNYLGGCGDNYEFVLTKKKVKSKKTK